MHVCVRAHGWALDDEERRRWDTHTDLGKAAMPVQMRLSIFSLNSRKSSLLGPAVFPREGPSAAAEAAAEAEAEAEEGGDCVWEAGPASGAEGKCNPSAKSGIRHACVNHRQGMQTEGSTKR